VEDGVAEALVVVQEVALEDLEAEVLVEAVREESGR
jgi:hypothetical protein